MIARFLSVGWAAAHKRDKNAFSIGLIALIGLASVWTCRAQDTSFQAGQNFSAGMIRSSIAYGPLDLYEAKTNFPRSSATRETWLSFDKLQHVTFGFLFTVGHQYTLVNKLDMSEKGALPISIAGTAAIGLAKELVDWKFRSRGHFSEEDLVADSVGILVAVGLILL
ncbi:MAG: hypothetical protein HKN13_10100 [Rhodothermales bacterium]|nr:hypothetical protein [Rhodothermales bacterium]